MPGKSLEEELKAHIAFQNSWLNIGMEILLMSYPVLAILGFWTWINWVFSVWDFHHLHQIFGIYNWNYFIAFVIGSILCRIALVVLVIIGVEKCNERTLLKWFMLTGICTIIEWSVIGLMSFFSLYSIQCRPEIQLPLLLQSYGLSVNF